jgi:serine/threonine-protein kinase TNNI3K
MRPCDEKIRFGVQLASGLCFLHSHGILHHDVKTDNALLDANHTVCKLSDFGLASLSLKYAGRKDRNSGSMGGTLRYLAPEKLKASMCHAAKSCDRGDGHGGSSIGGSIGGSSSQLSLGRALVSFEDRADVYAFALLLWELTHERRAFEGMTGAAAALSASRGLRPQFLEPHLYGMIPALTAECWAQRPEDRPSMSTVLERLETCMQAQQRSASTEPMAHSDTAKIACGDYELNDFEHGDSQAPYRAFADAHRARSSAIVGA